MSNNQQQNSNINEAFSDNSSQNQASGQSRPRFFNSQKGPTNVEPSKTSENASKLTSIKEQKSDTSQTPLSEEKKSEPKTASDLFKETNLAKHKIISSQLPHYDVKDGEFEHYPEITQKSVDKLKARGITGLFPIQQHCFYPIYNREDIIARDLTGSGKTLAFGLPLVEYLRKNQFLGQRKIQAIVLAPTRELALQVQNEFAKLKHYEDEFRTLTVYGGVSIDDQIRELRRGIDIFVGTTGRVLDHIERGNIDFTHMKTIILDEADIMLKLGFKEDIEQIMSIIKKKCQADLQICLFSATIPRWVKNVAQEHLKSNYRIIDLAQNLKNKTAKLVQHLAINCPSHNRMSALADLCEGRTIVFTQTKVDANSLILSDKIKQDIEVMHGDIAQNQREVTLKRFREAKFNVLVATDVASRGLDIPNVDLVIQVEPPNDVETYIHRSGRTARAGKEGTCITFYTKKTQYMIQQIEEQAGVKFKVIGVPQPEDVIKASSKIMLKGLTAVNNDVLPLFKEAAMELINNCGGDSEQALCKALAYISGHYKTALQSRSLLSGQEKQITLELRSLTHKWMNPVSTAVVLLKKYFPQNLSDHIKGMRGRANQMGIIFDIYEDQFDRFIEISNHLRETDSQIDFEIVKCLLLPELEGEDSLSVGGGGSAWRSGGNSYGGSAKHGRHQSYSNAKGDNFNNGQYQQPSYSGAGRGGFHSRQPSGTNQTWGANSNGPKSFQNSRKSSNISNNWDKESNNGSEFYQEENQGFNDFDVKIQPTSYGYKSKPSTFQKPEQQVNTSQSSKVFISNLHYAVTEDEIMDLFKEYNLKVLKLSLLKNEKGQCNGAGFIEFESAQDATTAVNELNGYEFNQRPATLVFAQPPGQRSGAPGSTKY